MHTLSQPDLEMRVRTLAEHGKTRLTYTLDSPTGVVDFSHHEIAGPLLQSKPEDFQAHLLQKIELFGERLDVDGSLLLGDEIERKLASLGRDLWRELFPTELRYAYRDIREKVHSWIIVSDEPWIPWELIKPYDDSVDGAVLDDEFLALRFELTRWLAPGKKPPQEIVVRSLVALRTASDLPQAKDELDALKDLADAHPAVLDVMPSLGSAVDLLKFLERGEAALIHFIGHGTHATDRADDSGVPFPDGSVLRPADLVGPVTTTVSRTRPLVFLNSCWAGRQSWTLTRLGGWAARWVGVCHCGAFVAPMWPVRDQTALAFMKAFYAALAAGFTLGQAAMSARQHVYQRHPGDPSALAYAVYGHPNGRIRFGEGVTATTPVERPLRPQGLPPIRPTHPRSPFWTVSRPRRALLAVALVTYGLVAIFHLSAGPVVDLIFPVDLRPLLRPKPTRATHPPNSTGALTKNVAGLRFIVSGARSDLNDALMRALESHAAPLIEEGVTGWTLRCQLEAPRVTTRVQDGFTMRACSLSGRASAQGPASRFDLGRIETTNAQFDDSACAAATESIAEAALSRFVNHLETKGDS